MPIAKTFLYRLYKKQKLVFYGTIFYLAVCLFTIIQSFQITPFYNWSMYSGATSKPTNYQFTEVYCDSTLLHQPHTLNDYSRMMITYTSHEYLKLIDSNYTRPTYDRVNRTLTKIGLDGKNFAQQLTVTDSMVLAYPAWLKRYIKKNLVTNFDRLRLYHVTVWYDSNANIQVVDKQLIFTQ